MGLCSVAQACPTLCDPINCSLPGSSVMGFFQARILEWVAISSFRGSSPPRDLTCVSSTSCIGRQILFTTLYIIYVNFSITLDKGLRQNNKKRDGKINKHKLREMRALNMKQKK